MRTIGGGEPWQNTITPKPGNFTDHIAQALDTIRTPRATAGDQFDYLPVTQTITFEVQKNFLYSSLRIMSCKLV